MQKYLIASLFFISLLSPLIAQTCVNSLNANQRILITNFHNNHRNYVAGGLQQDSYQLLPKASNMKTMIYDMSLERLAQSWANTNPISHNPNRVDPSLPGYVGENLYQSMTGTPDAVTPGNYDVMLPMQAWYNEVSYYNGDVSGYSPGSTTDQRKEIGHFAQMIWAETTRVGCGILECVTAIPQSGKTYYYHNTAFICNYWTGGTVVGWSIYNRGNVCSACPNGCSSAHPNLCA